jgi:hypothetical protein
VRDVHEGIKHLRACFPGQSLPFICSICRRSHSCLQISAGPLLGFVLLAAVARIAVQINNRRRLYLSDAFLIFACACLCTATGLLYALFDDLYLDEELYINPLSVALPPDFFDKVIYSLKLLFSVQTVLWAVVFSVKFSFLSFFRPLVSRLERLTTWWTVVVVFNFLAFVFCAADAFIICPQFNLSSSMLFNLDLHQL